MITDTRAGIFPLEAPRDINIPKHTAPIAGMAYQHGLRSARSARSALPRGSRRHPVAATLFIASILAHDGQLL